ncbi:MAG: cytochrome ubiquinol oxidase subunit I [Myxococcota bacterium]|jgi:cytochrome bd-type quinol oxidase subunit 1|nr:cytochrome ubiquinol oxidase subunit I [Myxococcota bacterium]
MLLVAAVLVLAGPALAQEGGEAYRDFPIVGSRVAIWVIAQLHLLFGAFVLAVPLFAVTIEYMGMRTGDQRYDDLAHEFTRLLTMAFSTTAIFGAMLLFMLLGLYPKFMSYLSSIFSATFLPYVLLFFGETFSLYIYYYGWGKLSPRVHLSIGVLLNVIGILVMMVANAWVTFMTSPAGIDDSGALVNVWDAIANPTWMPINIHRVIANVAFGGSIAGAYAAFNFLTAKTDEERAHYDWMGYIGNFVAIVALLPLPFAGYYLGREIYAFNQQMGITMMGGVFSWLFIVQAVLIGALFLAANYYLWLGMARIEGAERFRPAIKYLLILLTICLMIWATPHSMVASLEESRKMGGAHHPVLGFLGVMSAKNTAVNLMILTTYISFLLYRRGNRIATVAWARSGNIAQVAIFVGAAAVVIFLGVYGYYVEASVRIGFSVPQVGAVLFAMIAVTVIDAFLFKDCRETGGIRWGEISPRSQYALLLLAISFTWLMGLMGYVRSGLRQHWHVYGVVRDTSADAFTPTLGYATMVVSVTVLIFFAFLVFIFWLSRLSQKQAYRAQS